MSFTGKSPGNTYKDILQLDNSNSGVSSSASNIKDGNGSDTSSWISDRVLYVKSNTNDTKAFNVSDSGGTTKFNVDTTNGRVQALGHNVNTQYAYFGVNAVDSQWASIVDDTHYMVPFTTAFANVSLDTVANLALGTATTSSFNDTEPADSLTIGTTAHSVLPCYWYVPDDITIDSVEWFSTTEQAAGSTTASYLMKYNLDKGNSATSGDLSSGTKIAYSGNVTNNGYEQIHYNSMTISSANVDAGQVVLFTFAYDDTEASDYGISATIKYHLR